MKNTPDSLIAALLSLVSALQGVAFAQPPSIPTESESVQKSEVVVDDASINNFSKVREVPFYSQFADISDPAWKKIGCGIADLAMIIDYYKPTISVDSLLREAIDADAYLPDAGWIHAGLIDVSRKYGLDGASFDMAKLTMDAAFLKLQQAVKTGPVMASVYYTFTPGNPIPHLVVINDIKENVVYYNDPAEPDGGGTISVTDFKSAWKKRYIEIRPIS